MPINNVNGKIGEALLAHLESMSGGLGIADGDSIFDPNPDTPYLISNDVRFTTPRRYLSSDSPDEYAGFYMVDVMAPLAWTNAQRSGVIDNIANHFAKDTLISYGDLSFRVVGQPMAQGSAYMDGAFKRHPVKIDWKFEI